MKTCTKCGSYGPFSKGSYWCKICKSAFAREYYRLHRVEIRLKTKKTYPITQRRAKLRREYGITLEQYNEMFEAQGGRCAICKSDNPGSKNGWALDHCHTTKRVRAILCNLCNLMLGHSKDSVETHKAAIAYLNQYA